MCVCVCVCSLHRTCWWSSAAMCDQTFVAATFGPCECCGKPSPLINIYIKTEPINYCSFCVEVVRHVFLSLNSWACVQWVIWEVSEVWWGSCNTCVRHPLKWEQTTQQHLLTRSSISVSRTHTHTNTLTGSYQDLDEGAACRPLSPLLICGSLSILAWHQKTATLRSADEDNFFILCHMIYRSY